MGVTGAHGAYLPAPAPWTDPFWRALADNRLLLVRCAACETTTYPPVDERCPSCGSPRSWVAATGRSRLWSWTTIHREYVPGYPLAPPYTIVMVGLPEGLHMLAALAVDADPAELRCDAAMVFESQEVESGVYLPGWRAAS